jgi:succinoglycan biosynthesis protein ExoL
MHYTFFLPVLNDSHFNKRINNLKEIGINIKVIGFERNHYSGSSSKYDVSSLGFVEHGKYLKRIPTLIKSIFSVRKTVRNTDVLYCFNIETLLIGWLASLFQKGKIKIIYDVADIREILAEPGPVSSLLRNVERFLITKTKIVVVTSPAYIDGYFHKMLKLHDHDFHVIENKLDKTYLSKAEMAITGQDNKNSDVITIGYFGVIRCNHSLQLLNTLLEKAGGKMRLYIRGIFMDKEVNKEDILANKYVTYGGPFIAPDELTEMYNKVDLSWIALYHYKTNVKWCRTNRFYQACLFKKPMITQKGTLDSDQAEKHQIGCSIDLTNQPRAIQNLLNLNSQQIEKWKENMKRVPEEVYMLEDEHQILAEKINT